MQKLEISQLYIFIHTQPKKKNEYVFKKGTGEIQFLKDSIEYQPDIVELKNPKGTTAYLSELSSYVHSLLIKMDELKIREFTSDWSETGIDLKIYMDPDGVVLYVPDLKKVTAPRFKEYILSMKKMDEQWYYSLEDK